MEEMKLWGQEMVAGHTGQQYDGQSDENEHTSGILIKVSLNIRSSFVGDYSEQNV